MLSSSRKRSTIRALRAPLLALVLVASAYVGSVQAAPPLMASVNAGTPQGGRVFAPRDAAIDVGGTVTWTNVSKDEHTVTSDTAEPFNEVLAEPPPAQDQFEHTFNEAGTFAYHCRRHGTATTGMRGRVVVGEFSRTLSIAYSQGAFRGSIDSVRPQCERAQRVTVFKVRQGADQRLGASNTDNQGAYAFPEARRAGKYYAKVPRTTPSGACLSTESAKLTLR
jgi:plastocyanin